jgi:hypothetical protein
VFIEDPRLMILLENCAENLNEINRSVKKEIAGILCFDGEKNEKKRKI